MISDILRKIEQEAKNIVWWSPSQIERGEDLANNPDKGERPWIIPETTGRFLHEKISALKPQNILELGTSIGYSTLWLADAALPYGGHIHSIEMKEKKLEYARRYAEEAGLDATVAFHEGKISDILPTLSAITFDFIFMDADRGHYHEYFPLFEKNLSSGAVIIADNAKNMQDRMLPFLHMLKEKGWQYEILDFDNGVLFAKRSSKIGSPL